jgi:hypothetical protein
MAGSGVTVGSEVGVTFAPSSITATAVSKFIAELGWKSLVTAGVPFVDEPVALSEVELEVETSTERFCDLNEAAR